MHKRGQDCWRRAFGGLRDTHLHPLPLVVPLLRPLHWLLVNRPIHPIYLHEYVRAEIPPLRS